MIWTDLIEEFPEDGYIHPLHEGKGHDGRKYRPVWHAVESTKGMDYNIVTDGGEELESGVRRDAHEEDECLLCVPAGHENCEKYTVVQMLDPARVPLGEDDTDHLVSIPVCLGHYEAFEKYQRGENVGEIWV